MRSTGQMKRNRRKASRKKVHRERLAGAWQGLNKLAPLWMGIYKLPRVARAAHNTLPTVCRQAGAPGYCHLKVRRGLVFREKIISEVKGGSCFQGEESIAPRCCPPLREI